jgi:membrane protease YdiL (CAAX protease family)
MRPAIRRGRSTGGNDAQGEALISMIRRHPVAAYFALTFVISWTGALAVAAPHLVRHEPLSKMTGILMFPVMLLGPSLAGVVLTRLVDGKGGLRVLVSQVFRARVPLVWYATLLIPPVLILSVLVFLERFVSPVYAPNRFFLGVLFGIPAGFLEEIGWTGYAFPKMRSPSNGLAPSILLGLLWSLWHLPVINYLGAAAPHGVYWLPFFLAFSLAMTAMRMLIAWIYTNTKSLFLAQLMHVSSTGSLVVFGAAGVTAGQEALWYALYGTVLWVAVGIIVKIFGGQLGLRDSIERTPDRAVKGIST